MADETYQASAITHPPNPNLPGIGGVLYGEGAPGTDLGRVGNVYVNIQNGDIYTKKETGWELQSGGGGGGANNLIGDISPLGVELPDYEGQYYFNRVEKTLWVANGSTVNDWEQIV